MIYMVIFIPKDAIFHNLLGEIKQTVYKWVIPNSYTAGME